MSQKQMAHEMPKWGTREWCQFVQTNSAAFDALPSETYTEDGLVLCKDLIRVPTERSFTLWLRKHDNISVAANTYSSSVADYISGDLHLWESAAIRVVSQPGISGRAPMFGVPFRRAVAIALRKGFMKCEFYLPDQKDDVYYATLLFHVNKRKESNGSVTELQVWQYCPGHSEVFYVHAESSDFAASVSHLDGAIIRFPPDDVVKLFSVCDKIKSEDYEKQFRLDGEFPMEDMLNIVSAYLPVSELVDEAFQVYDRAK
jgi:hypothetical protein